MGKTTCSRTKAKEDHGQMITSDAGTRLFSVKAINEVKI